MALHFLFIDFNSFFASVEQQLRPELRGKPVGVAAVMAETTSFIAASYEAKKFGVKTGTMVREAKRLCPGLHVIEARPPLYIEYHHKLLKAVETCVPVHSVLSIDEMSCELTGSQQQPERARSLALLIKKTIAREVGTELRCSIGIAPNLFLSKTASDMQKPDGLVIIDHADLPQCLYRLELEDLTGIGRKMKPRLERHGIHTVKDLCTADKALLRKVWGGIEGDRMYGKLRGESVYTPLTHRSTIGHSHVLPPAERNDPDAFAVLNRLAQKASMRLRKYGHLTGALAIDIKYMNNSHFQDEITFDPTQDTLKIIEAVTAVWNRRSVSSAPILRVGVTLMKLEEIKHRTLPLFDDTALLTLNAAIDKLNLRYGKNTIYFGGAHTARDSAPARIAFTHVPDYE